MYIYIYIYIYIYKSILWQLPFLKNYQNHSMDLSAMGHCHSDFEVFRSSLLILVPLAIQKVLLQNCEDAKFKFSSARANHDSWF